MRKLNALFLATALLLGVTMTAQAELLDEVTGGSAMDAVAMTSAELDAVVGEGSVEKFVEIPNFPRSFERTIEVGPNTLSISAVAGVGITLSATGPDVPDI